MAIAKRSRRPSMEMKINNSCLFLLLPIEIVVEIFSRLPVDSVSQCKLVCKTWLDVINHHFKKYSIVMMGGTFLLRQPYGESAGFHYGPSRFHYGEYYNDDKQIPCFNLTKKPIFNHDQYPFENANKWYVVSSCNGLICLRQRWLSGNYRSPSYEPDDMYVCNPYTGEYVKLPNPNYPRLLGQSGFVNIVCGFGYHAITKEYKVIRICYEDDISGIMSISRGHVEVYTLGSDTAAWRSIGEIQDRFYKTIVKVTETRNSSCGILLNGALYWLTDKILIVSFDLADEEFRDISSPPELRIKFSVLGVLNGCLCVINNVNRYKTHIWVMNNKDDSWSKKFNISWNKEHYICNNYPLAHLESGKILLRSNCHTLASYDPETKHIVELKMKPVLFDLIPYMKSSVSLKALGETEAIQVTSEEGNKKQQQKTLGEKEAINTSDSRRGKQEASVEEEKEKN